MGFHEGRRSKLDGNPGLDDQPAGRHLGKGTDPCGIGRRPPGPFPAVAARFAGWVHARPRFGAWGRRHRPAPCCPPYRRNAHLPPLAARNPRGRDEAPQGWHHRSGRLSQEIWRCFCFSPGVEPSGAATDPDAPEIFTRTIDPAGKSLIVPTPFSFRT